MDLTDITIWESRPITNFSTTVSNYTPTLHKTLMRLRAITAGHIIRSGYSYKAFIIGRLSIFLHLGAILNVY